MPRGGVPAATVGLRCARRPTHRTTRGPRPTGPSPGRSLPSPGLPVPRRQGPGRSTSARPRTSAPGCRPTSRTSATSTSAPPRWSPRPPASSGRSSKTEVEALQLEYSWIKEFDPRFNVKYRDDKSYPWLAVTIGDEFPRVMVGRGAKKKGTRYFGPYSHAWAIRETVDLLLRVFPMRSCTNGVFKRSAPDRPAVPARLHRQVLRALRRPDQRRGPPRDRRGLLRLHGRPDRGLRASASRRRCTPPPRRSDYEKAARLRDDLGAMQKALEKQAVVLRRRHRRRRDRARRGPARGGCPDLLRPWRPDPRPARLGRRPGRRGRHRRAGRGLPPPAVRRRLRRHHPARDPGAGAAARRRDLRAAAHRPAGQQGLGPGAAARRQEGAPGDRGPQRRPGARAAQDQARHRPDHPQPGAGGDPGGARASTRSRCGSSATTCPTSRAPRWSRRWWSSRTAWPARASTAASHQGRRRPERRRARCTR